MASQDDKECSDDENDEHDTQGHKDITINQKPDAINLGHGAVVWDAAVVFCKYLEHNSSIYSVAYLKDKKILELGAGCGLSGLTTMMKGAIVTLTDLQCVVDTLLSQNAEHTYNKMISMGSIGLTLHRPQVIALDWTQPCEALNGCTFDIILLTDCIFSVTLTDALIGTILRYCTNKTEILCCHEIRDEDANRAFVASLKEHCSVKQISSHKLHPEYKSDQINIFSAKLKRKK